MLFMYQKFTEMTKIYILHIQNISLSSSRYYILDTVDNVTTVSLIKNQAYIYQVNSTH